MKYKVFVSGNQKELAEERIAVKEVIINTLIIRDFFEPFLFEDLPAGGSDAVSTYIEEVKKSDVYIGILGYVYGQKNQNGISASEMEYDEFVKAVNNGEKLIFIKGREDDRRDPEIMQFFEKAKDVSIYRRFNSILDLQKKIIQSLESFLKNEGVISSDEFDERINREIGFEAIAEDEVRDFLQKRAIDLNVGIPDAPVKDILLDILKVLRVFKGEIRPTNTGILFFSREASEYIPQNEIRIARFDGVTRAIIIDSQEIRGPIYHMIDQVEHFFRRNTRTANKILGFKRIDIHEYPYEAIREALINAIAHRDYNRTGAPIMFSIYDDRVEISSPGELVSGVTLDNIGTKHETRNGRICKIFHETKDMEKFGTGIQKMRDSMKLHGLQEPDFRIEDKSFVVTFFGPGANILDLANSIPDERMVNLKDFKLNERQIRALEMMVNQKITFTNNMYQEEFGVSRFTASRDLKGLVEKGQGYVIGKGKGTKYKATNNGDA